jgi:hypothetical protein
VACEWRPIDAVTSSGYTPDDMTQAASQAAAFYREVVRDRRVWTIFDEGGYPAPMTSNGRAQPFWSSKARAVRATKTPAYRGFEIEEVAWDTFVGEVLPGLERDGLLVGVNWSGPRQTGYDLRPSEVIANMAAQGRPVAPSEPSPSEAPSAKSGVLRRLLRRSN